MATADNGDNAVPGQEEEEDDDYIGLLLGAQIDAVPALAQASDRAVAVARLHEEQTRQQASTFYELYTLDPASAGVAKKLLKQYRAGLRQFCVAASADMTEGTEKLMTAFARTKASEAQQNSSGSPLPLPPSMIRSPYLQLQVALQEVVAGFQKQLNAKHLASAADEQVSDELLRECFLLLAQIASLSGLPSQAVRLLSIATSLLWHAAFRATGDSATSFMPNQRWNNSLQTTLKEWQERLADVKRTNQHLQQAVARKSNSYHLAKGSTKALSRESAILKQKHASLSGKVAVLEAELQERQEQYSGEAEVVRKARRAAEELESRITTKQLRIRQLQEKIHKVMKQIDSHPVANMPETADHRTKSLVQNAEKEIQVLHNRLHRIIKEHEAKLNAHAAMLREIDQCVHEQRMCQTELQLLKKERDELRTDQTPRPDWETILQDVPVFDDSRRRRPPNIVTATGLTLPPAQVVVIKSRLRNTASSVDHLKYLVQRGRKFYKNVARDLVVERAKYKALQHDLAQAKQTLARLEAQRVAVLGTHVQGEGTGILEAAASLDPSAPLEYKWVDGLGTGSDVPPYLRLAGKIRVRIHRKPEVDSIVRDVWKMSMLSQNDDETMQDVISAYLKNRYGIQGLVVKAGYSFIHSMRLYFWDSDVELLAMALKGEMSHQVKVDQLAMIEGFKDYLRRVDLLDQGKVSNKIPASYVSQALTAYFPRKSSERLSEILDACKIDSGNDDIVDYSKLFSDNDSGISRTLLVIRGQHMAEIKEVVKRLKKAVATVSKATPLLNVTKLELALKKMDPTMPEEVMQEYLARGLAISVEEVPAARRDAEKVLVQGKHFVARLLKGLVKMHDNYVPDAVARFDDLVAAEAKRAHHSKALAQHFRDDASRIRRAIGSLRKLTSSPSSPALRRGKTTSGPNTPTSRRARGAASKKPRSKLGISAAAALKEAAAETPKPKASLAALGVGAGAGEGDGPADVSGDVPTIRPMSAALPEHHVKENEVEAQASTVLSIIMATNAARRRRPQVGSAIVA